MSDLTIQSVGNSLGAECVVLGKIEDSSSGWKFSLKAVQVETKKILSVWSGTISKNDKDVKFIVSKSVVCTPLKLLLSQGLETPLTGT